MRFFTTISLAILFLFNAIGFQLLFAYLIIQREDEMNNYLLDANDKALEVITIDLSDHPEFFQINEKEIFYKGSMYDVKFKEVNDNKITFHCEKDVEELDLLSHFSKVQDERKENNNKNPLSRFIQKSAQNLFFQNQNLISINFPIVKIHWFVFNIRYDQPDPFLLTPPPQYSVS